jgi:hypothetical protein
VSLAAIPTVALRTVFALTTNDGSTPLGIRGEFKVIREAQYIQTVKAICGMRDDWLRS